MENRVLIIGAGFSSLAASCHLAQKGYDVTVLEKNSHYGGRAQVLRKDGFKFDMGPSFYWMPDVFEDFFKDFDKHSSDYYQLDRLNPSYKVFFDKLDCISIADNMEDIQAAFDEIEPGSGESLRKFIDKAGENYKIAINDLVYNPGETVFEIINAKSISRLNLFLKSIKKQVAGVVSNDKLKKVLEFPVLFLGAKSSDTPAFYNFMNYADFKLGTWHPLGGMHEVAKAMYDLSQELGVKMILNSPVDEISIENKQARYVMSGGKKYEFDILLSGADYAHTESLLPEGKRQYSEKYWDSRKLAPSALMFYVGFNKKLKNISHHCLFFDTSFENHEKAIYDDPKWMSDPLFYGSFASVTDDSFAPEGKEAGTFLIPLAPGLHDSEEIRNEYFEHIIKRLEHLTDQKLRDDILFFESYCVKDFVEEYNSLKGNAYGLANTLTQTHVLRPRMRSKKIQNLYFTGQLTVPGPGVPPSLISGKIVSDLIERYHPVNERVI